MNVNAPKTDEKVRNALHDLGSAESSEIAEYTGLFSGDVNRSLKRLIKTGRVRTSLAEGNIKRYRLADWWAALEFPQHETSDSNWEIL